MRAVTVVGPPVASQPPSQFGMRVGAAHGGDFVRLRGIDSELQSKAVRGFQVHRQAVAMIDGSDRDAGGRAALLQFIETGARRLFIMKIGLE